MIGLTSTPGTHEPATRANRDSWLRSDISASAAPGYWILTATSRPSRHTPRCTWPMDADAAGTSSNSTSLVLAQRGPSSRARISCTRSAPIGGPDSCSLVRVARYGPAISSGIAASMTDSA